MAAYNITLSDGVTVITIPDGSTTYTQADIPLVGQNAQLYGDPVATALLYSLENFANTTAPSVAPLTGQVWYDTTAANKTLNVYNGTTWDQVANTNVGTLESSTLRWDNTNKKWLASQRVTLSAAGALTVVGPTPGNSVSFTHDDTNLDVVGLGTTDINVTSGITAVNLPEITLTTALDEIYGGTGQTVYAVGDIVYASSTTALSKLSVGSNGDVLTLAAGVPTWVAGAAGVTALNDLSDVTLTTPANNSLLYRSGGVYIDSNIANLSFDGTNLVATQIAGIANANLVDKAATEIIAGSWSFTNVQPITASAGDIDATNGFGFVTTDGATAAAFRADTGTNEIQFTHSNSPDWNITGLGLIVAANPIHATSIASAASFRSIGDAATWSATDSYISFYDNAGVHGLEIGTLAADGGSSRINARLGQLDLYASNTKVVNFQASLHTFTAGGVTALELRNSATSSNTTSAAVSDNSGNLRNVGYNETPLADDGGANINVGSFTLGAISIGKMISRTTTTSRSVTLNADPAIPVGGSVLIHNGASGGTLTIIPAGGQTLNWIDGSGTLPASATRTLANNSICTVRKVNSTTWQIWGNGIS